MTRWTMVVGCVLVIGSALLSAQERDASQMRLQVLNGRTGRPVPRQKVVVMAGDGVHAAHRLLATNTDGEGYVMLPEVSVPPRRLQIVVELFRSCARLGVNTFETARVAANGVVSENACKPRISLFPQPGTLVFFVRPETWLERMRR